MESDLSLINKIKESNDCSCLNELINRHSGIYVYMVDKYTKSNTIDRDFILEEKDHTIYQSALNFDPDKNSKFSSFLANQTKFKCLNAINGSKLTMLSSKNESFFDNLSYEQDPCKIIGKIEAFDIFNQMLEEESDKRVKKIIDIRYNTDNTKLVPWKRASEKLGVSIQGCINIHNRFIKKVKKKLEQKYV